MVRKEKKIKSYDKYVAPYLDKFVKIQVSQNKKEKVEKFIEKLIPAKSSEQHHKVDRSQREKRFLTGFLGEAAIEEFIGKEFIDYSIGHSSKYHVSDLKSLGYDLGIKTVEAGKLHVIFAEPKSAEILVVKENDNTFFICGIATVDVMKKYQDINEIIDPMLRKRGSKTGFIGYEYLLPLTSIKDLENFKIK